MTRIQEILVRVRDTLADPRGERWSDSRLIRLIDEAQLDICMRAKLLRSSISFNIIDGVADYKLPDDVMLIDRVVVNGNRIDLISHNYLDEHFKNWECDKGKVTHCVFDKQRRGHIKLYPIPEMGSKACLDFEQSYSELTPSGIIADFGEVALGNKFGTVAQDFGCVTDMIGVVKFEYEGQNPNVEIVPYVIPQDFGCVTKILYDQPTYKPKEDFGEVVKFDGYTTNSDFGMVTGIFDNTDYYTMNDDFGVITGLDIMASVIEINYLKKPNKVSTLYDNLEIEDLFDKAIKYYVVSQALKDDMDTQNRVVGNEEFQFYLRELEIAMRDDTLDFTRNNNKQYRTEYWNGFNR